MEQFFIHPGLASLGALLVGVPVLIHLINLMRHRRVQWAAMEFLLAAYKKSRTWVILKQLLLLLLRMLAVAAVALIVAQPLLQADRWFLLGGQTTHHIVLLDDSFSMADRHGDRQALDLAKDVVLRLARRAVQARSPQKFTLVRFSRPRQPDLNAALVDAQFESRLVSELNRITPSQTDAGPLAALQALDQLLEEAGNEKRVVYLVSDFRQRQWQEPKSLDQQLQQLRGQEVEVQLVQCVDQQHENLAILRLEPASGTRAAGVPVTMEVTVHNYGTSVAREVAVTLREDGRERPGVVIRSIGPGQSETRRFTVQFATAGQHYVTARLAADAVEADNVRYCVLDLPVSVPVLVCDGDPAATDGRFLSLALAPSSRVRSGIAPRVELPRFLNNHPLENFQGIYLTNFSTLDQVAIENLERYVRGGGGLAIFMGEEVRAQFVNQHLYRDGQGLFPVPLVTPVDLIPDPQGQKPDVEPDTSHPVFRIFEYLRNDFLKGLRVYRYFAVPQDWQSTSEHPVRVVARLRNGAPLVLEHRFGRGRVIVFLTSVAPVWNNWVSNPSFLVSIQELQSYLARWSDPGLQVGQPLVLRVPAAQYAPEAQLRRLEAEPLAVPLQGELKDETLTFRWEDTALAAVYQWELQPAQGGPEHHTYAVNVNPEEGDLAYFTPEQLDARLEAEVKILPASAVSDLAATQARSSASEYLLYALILLLLGEQLLAYSASYHPPSLKGVRA